MRELPRGLSARPAAGLRQGDIIQKINEFIPAVKPPSAFSPFADELSRAEKIWVNRGTTDLTTYARPATADLRW